MKGNFYKALIFSMPYIDAKGSSGEQISSFYKREFWDEMQCDDLEAPLDIVVFDTIVALSRKQTNEFLKLSRSWRDVLFYRIQYQNGKKAKWSDRCIGLWELARTIEKEAQC